MTILQSDSVDLVIFACLDFREFLILGFFTKFSFANFHFSLVALFTNNFRDILDFANLFFSLLK